jgi:hypothetical protein
MNGMTNQPKPMARMRKCSTTIFDLPIKDITEVQSTCYDHCYYEKVLVVYWACEVAVVVGRGSLT